MIMDKISIEDKFKEIDELLLKLSDKELSLEDSFSLYKDGLTKLKECNEIVDGIEKQLKVLQEEDSDV